MGTNVIMITFYRLGSKKGKNTEFMVSGVGYGTLLLGNIKNM